MKASQPFDYAAFRQRAVQQIQKGNPDQVDLVGLLAPVISDILETALLPDYLPSVPVNVPITVAPTSYADEHAVSSGNSGNILPSNQRLRKQNAQPYVHKNRPDSPRPIKPVLPPITEETVIRAKQRIIELYREGRSYNTIRSIVDSPLQPYVDTNFIRQTIGQLSVEIQNWQKRSLESVFVCVWVISRTCQVLQDDKLSFVAVYSVVGINVDGKYDILGYYTNPQGPNEFFHRLLDDLKSRGVKDILIICLDSLFDISTTINNVYPQTHVHGIVMRIVESCLKPIRGKNLITVQSAIKKVYTAPTRAESEQLWQAVKTVWKSSYPRAITQWEKHWPAISGVFDYPDLVRELTRDTRSAYLTQKLIDNSDTVNGSDTTEGDLLQALRAQSMYVFYNRRNSRNNWGPTMKQVSDVFSKRRESS